MFNKKNKKIKIIIGKPILRSDLSEDKNIAITELRNLTDKLKSYWTTSPVLGLTPKLPTMYPNSKGVVTNPPNP